MRVEIEKKDRTYSFDAEPGESILYAGLRAGIPLPYECATGTCGTCRARLKQGQLDSGWEQAPGKKNLKSDRQELLLCQAMAKQKDCTLSMPSPIRQFRDDDLVPGHCNGVAEGWQKLTPEVMRFEVKLDTPVRYHPGQFFVIKAPGVCGFRAYSMVNYAAGTDNVGTDRLEFIIKRKPDGGFSNWVFEAAENAQPVHLFGPLGRATFHSDESYDLVMVAGGSGIAGLLSILEHACNIDYLETHRVTVFFGIRTAEDVFFADRLSTIQQRYPTNAEINLVFSEQTPHSLPDSDIGCLGQEYGMVHEVALQRLSEGVSNRMIYLAGPPPMVDAAIRGLIVQSQVPADRIRYDKFG